MEFWYEQEEPWKWTSLTSELSRRRSTVLQVDTTCHNCVRKRQNKGTVLLERKWPADTAVDTERKRKNIKALVLPFQHFQSINYYHEGKPIMISMGFIRAYLGLMFIINWWQLDDRPSFMFEMVFILFFFNLSWFCYFHNKKVEGTRGSVLERLMLPVRRQHRWSEILLLFIEIFWCTLPTAFSFLVSSLF